MVEVRFRLRTGGNRSSGHVWPSFLSDVRAASSLSFNSRSPSNPSRPMIGQFVSKGALWLADFQLPAHYKPTEDLLRIGLKVGTQQGLGFELSFRITDQNPAHGHREQARGVPHGRLGRDFDHTLPAPVPAGDLGRFPNSVRVFGHHRKVGQPRALYARSPYLMGGSWRSRFIKGSIQAQAAD